MCHIPVNYPWLGAKPDGIVMKDNKIDTVVEVKCPYTSRYTSQRPQWVVLKRDGTYGLKPKSRYYYQVQAQMFVTEARRCVFGVFTPKLTYVMVVDRDDHFIQVCVEMTTSIKNACMR